MRTLVDNDVLFKLSCFNLLESVLAPLSQSGSGFAILGAARFVVNSLITRSKLRGSRRTAAERLNAFFAAAEEIEPTGVEIELAAEFELSAQRAGRALDYGESLLCSVLICRAARALVTGDKRAIAAIEHLATMDRRMTVIAGKIHCLEQLISRAVDAGCGNDIRSAICSEADLDKTLSICFGCGRDVSSEHLRDGLNSYIADLRRIAPLVLSQ